MANDSMRPQRPKRAARRSTESRDRVWLAPSPAHRAPRVDRCSAGSKVRYPDVSAAKEALLGIKYERQVAATLGLESRRLERRVYQCPSCCGWHLTSSSSDGRRSAVATARPGSTWRAPVSRHQGGGQPREARPGMSFSAQWGQIDRPPTS